jgi:hypothetical protein
MGDSDVSEMTTADATSTGVGPLVSSIYANESCVSQQGDSAIIGEDVVDTGPGGPALLFWQASAWTPSAPTGLKLQPVIGPDQDPMMDAAAFANQSSVHMALLRRRALLSPLPPGESFVNVYAAGGVVTDPNDAVTMTLLNLGAMSQPPQVRMAVFGFAAGSGNEYASESFESAGGPLLISVSATAWSQVQDQMIGAVLYLDGEPIATPQLFANQPSNHAGLVGTDVVVLNLAAGGHQLVLLADSQTVCDTNDVWSLTVTEMMGSASAYQLFNVTPCPTQTGGSLIASGPYTARGGAQLVCVHLSGYSEIPNQMLQAHLVIDGNPVGSLEIFANQAQTHMLLCGGDIAIGSLPPGQHVIEVVADDGLCTDDGDRVSLTIVEVFS